MVAKRFSHEEVPTLRPSEQDAFRPHPVDDPRAVEEKKTLRQAASGRHHTRRTFTLPRPARGRRQLSW